MRMRYDTGTVHPLDRYDYYRAGAASESAPFAVYGRAPGHLLAAMSVARIGDFEIETMTWDADSEIVTRRTDRLIRACDPESYRIILSVNGGVREEQAGNRVSFRARDLALYDLSHPQQSIHTTRPASMRDVRLTFPKALVPVPEAAVRPLLGTLMPRSLPGCGLIARFLVELADTAARPAEAGTADVLHECTTGLIRQRLGQPDGITLRTRRLLLRAHVQRIIRRHHADPALDPDRIAKAASVSPRYLHTIFDDVDLTPMQLLKRLRLEECHRSLLDPALTMTPIKDIVARHGYRRPDQFARDFKQQFGVSANQVRRTRAAAPPTREAAAAAGR